MHKDIERILYTENDIENIVNTIAKQLVPEFKRLNPSFEQTALGDCQAAREADEFLNRCAVKAIGECKTEFGYDCKKLAGLDAAVLNRVIIILIKNNCNLSPTRKTVILTADIIKNGIGGVELSKAWTAAAKQGIFRIFGTFGSEISNGNTEISLKENMTFSLCGKTFNIKPNETIHYDKNININVVKSELIGQNAVFRTRRAGDRFTYADRKITKPLRKVMNEMKIPAEIRPNLVLLAVGNTVMWCEKIGASLEGQSTEGAGLIIS